MGNELRNSINWKMNRGQMFLALCVFLIWTNNAVDSAKLLIGVKQQSSSIPNNCIYEYKVDVGSSPAPCSEYISMMMENYNLDENSVPIAPPYRNPSIPLAKQQSQSMQLYVGTGNKEPLCNYTLKRVVDEADCCAGYQNFPACNISDCYSKQGGCRNGGVCNSPNLCTCPPNYTGLLCDEDIQSVITKNHPTLLYCYQTNQCFSHKKTNFTGIPVSFKECCQDKTGSWGSEGGSCTSCTTDFQGSTSKTSTQNFTTCHSYGFDFFRTFDNQLYTFQGRCSYSLLTPKNYAGSWAVRIDYDGCTKSSTVNCTKRAVLGNGDYLMKGDAKGVYFRENPYTTVKFVRVDNTQTAITIPGSNVFAYRQDESIILTLEAGNLKVKWDAHSNIYISMHSSIYFGKVEGLCGNADGDRQNDFFGADNIASFGNYFKEPNCPDIANTVSVCNEEDQQLANQQCSKIRLKFAGCSNLENSDPYFQMCVQHICERSKKTNLTANKEALASIICIHLSAYAEACAEKGSCIQWRSDTLCEKRCPGNKIWSDCASECPVTCRNLFQTPSTYCQASRVGRCVCRQGEVEYGDTCIQASECPCLYDGKEHAPGSTRQFECNTCTCKSSLWKCTVNECPSTCLVMGTQYETFDGARYTFNDMGGKYALVQPVDGNTDPRADIIVAFQSNSESITNENDDSAYMNLPRIIYLQINGTEVIFKATTPGLGDTPTYRDDSRNIIVKKLTNIFVGIQVGNYFALEFDGSKSFSIKATSLLKNKINGLCGKFDGNSENDLTEKSNDIRESVVKIAMSYRIKIKIKLKVHIKIKLPKLIPDPCTCETNDACTKIFSGPEFSACMSSGKVDKDYYLSYCRRETIGSKVTLAYCGAIFNAAIACRKFGIQFEISFTSDLLSACVPKCETGGAVFQLCSRTCQKTCRQLGESSAAKCDDNCYPGCDCKPGYYRTGSGQCVAQPECTCWNPLQPDDPEVPAGTVVVINCQNCVCANGTFSCNNIDACRPPTCPKNQKYLKRVSTCNSCSNFDSCLDDSENKNVCGCPDGTVSKVDGTCVQPSDCPCSYMSKEYSPNAVITIKCSKYICKNRKWKLLEENDNNCEAVCIAYGDPHYLTFDGQMFSFQGGCSYTMLQTAADPVNNMPAITISVANIACGYHQVTCTKFVQLMIGNQTYILTRGSNNTIPSLPQYGVVIEELTLFTQLVSDQLGLRVMWDKSTRVYIFIKTNFHNKVQGLCGNYDGDIQNEFMHGTMKYEDAVQFAQSWITNADICPMDISPESNGTKNEQDMCNANPDRKDWAQKMCGIIRDPNGVFKSCVEAMHQDINRFYATCLFDACACNRGGDCECLCTSLATFATQCAVLGSPVKWRSQDLCPIMCEGGKRYTPCVSPCPQTCETVGSARPKHCDTANCVEGCSCPAGMIDRNGECVPPTSCPCYHKGKVYSNGSIVYMEECKICQCLNNKFECREDYLNCTTTCKPNQYRCNNGKCINPQQLCDGKKDCDNGEDEKNCNIPTCKPQEFTCVSNGICIPMSKKCDGVWNCLDGSDESSCGCLPHQYTCKKSKICLEPEKKCNGVMDCGENDASDEDDCRTTTVAICTSTDGMTDSNIIREQDVTVTADSRNIEKSQNKKLGELSGLQIQGQKIIINIDLTKQETQVAIITRIILKIVNTDDIQQTVLEAKPKTGESKTINIDVSIIKNSKNIIEEELKKFPDLQDMIAISITIVTKPKPEGTSPSINIQIQIIGCFTPKTTTPAPISTTMEIKTTGEKITTETPPRKTTTEEKPTATTTSKPCTSTDGMKDNAIIRPEDITVTIDGRDQPTSNNNKLGEIPGLPVNGRTNVITVTPTKESTQTAIVTSIVVYIDKPTDVTKVEVTVTPSKGRDIPVQLTTRDLENPINIINQITKDYPDFPDILKFQIKIETRPLADGSSPTITIRIEVIGCFTPKEVVTTTSQITRTSSQPVEITTEAITEAPSVPTTTELKTTAQQVSIETPPPYFTTKGQGTTMKSSTSTVLTISTTSSSKTTIPMCSEWSNWSACNVSCGFGAISRFRNCSKLENQIDVCYGSDCDCLILFPVIKSKINREIVEAWIERDNIPGLSSNKERVLDGSFISNNVTLFINCGNCTCKNAEISCRSDARCKKDCQWSSWTEWSDCKGPCDGSSQSRSRTVIQQPIYGGKVCEPNGNEEIRNCPNRCICEWSPWSDWTNCTKSCGGGTTSRTRSPLNSGCNTSPDSSTNTASCNNFPCKNDTTTPLCNGNKTMQSCFKVRCPRTCFDVQTSSAGCEESYTCQSGCFCAEGYVEDDIGNCVRPENCCNLAQANCKECELASCRNGVAICTATENCDCKWKPWQEWSPCNRICGHSNQTRTRIKSTDQRGSGKPCEGSDVDTQQCPFVPCTNCTESGSEEIFMSGAPMTPTSPCVECFCNFKGQKECKPKNDKDKPQASWTDWCPWSICSGNCPNGTRTRERNCIDPCEAVSTRCNGSRTESEPCKMKCQVDCVPGDWKNSSECNAECTPDKPIAYGIVKQVRDIITQPINGGKQCETNRTISCQKECPVDCKVIEFDGNAECIKTCSANDTTCDPSCGTGIVTKIPKLVQQAQNGGKKCEPVYEPCNLGNCSTPCLPPKKKLPCVNPCEQRCSDLSKQCMNILSCVESCSCPNNTVEQDGKCVPKSSCRCKWNPDILGPKPDNYDEELQPETVIKKECNNCTCRQGQFICTTEKCTQDCQWSDWKEVESCNVTCGKGVKVMERVILKPAQFGGKDCEGPNKTTLPCYASSKCCEPNVIFEPENNNCERTCEDVINKRHPQRNCAEGCKCQPGSVRDANNKCVPISDCFRCVINGTTWQNGETKTDLAKCELNVCSNGELTSSKLTFKNGLPPCSLDDEEFVKGGDVPVINEEGCCYKSSIIHCGVNSIPITSLTLENNHTCALMHGQVITKTVCAGGCPSKFVVNGKQTNEDPVEKYNRLNKLLYEDKLVLPEEFQQLALCRCCHPVQFKVIIPTEYTCLDQVTNEVKTGVYVDIKITKCSCTHHCVNT